MFIVRPLPADEAVMALPCVAKARAAQQATDDGTKADSGDIAVTAQQHEQLLQDVLISFTVMSGDQFSSAGVADISSLRKIAAGVRISNYGASAPVTSFNIPGLAQLGSVARDGMRNCARPRGDFFKVSYHF